MPTHIYVAETVRALPMSPWTPSWSGGIPAPHVLPLPTASTSGSVWGLPLGCLNNCLHREPEVAGNLQPHPLKGSPKHLTDGFGSLTTPATLTCDWVTLRCESSPVGGAQSSCPSWHFAVSAFLLSPLLFLLSLPTSLHVISRIASY